MAAVVGVVLAVCVCVFGTAARFDRDRAFYPTMTIVIASYYALFAVMGGSTRALATESIAIAAFVLCAVAGFKTNLWLVSGALCAHGVYDFIHQYVIANPGVPVWWPAFCGAFDVTAGAYLAALIIWRRRSGTRDERSLAAG